MTEDEYNFARAMLAEPTAENRLVYADWLCDEVGDVERAELVREAEGWDDSFWEPLDPMWRFQHEGQIVFSIRIPPEPYSDLGVIAHIYDWRSPDRLFDSLDVRSDGTSPDDPYNWAWLLSLAMARGLKIHGLNAPVADPDLET